MIDKLESNATSVHPIVPLSEFNGKKALTAGKNSMVVPNAANSLPKLSLAETFVVPFLIVMLLLNCKINVL